MIKNEVFNTVVNVIHEFTVFRGEIALETTFNEMDMDSLDTMEFIMEIETVFQIEFKDEDIDKISTVGDVTQWIASNL